MSQPTYTKEQIRRYLSDYHHLTDAKALAKGDLVDFVAKVGCVQFDPLDPVGRNPDLVFQARCSDYQRDDYTAWLYEDFRLFDVWDKCMSIAPIERWPHFHRYRHNHLHWCREHQAVIDQISAHLREVPCACSSDFALEEKTNWHYGPQRMAKAALEAMCYAGLAVVHHKKGTRRYYALAEHHVPAEIIEQGDPFENDADYQAFFVHQRLNSIGLLWQRPSDAFLGYLGYGRFTRAERNRAFDTLKANEKICEIHVEDINMPLYIDVRNFPLLDQATEERVPEEVVRFIAPLDNMIWDRKLIEALYGFHYGWEVYVPAAERKYGYYVLPMYIDDRFIGRIEMATDKKTQTLQVKDIWWEDGMKKRDYTRQLNAGLARFKKYNKCKRIEK